MKHCNNHAKVCGKFISRLKFSHTKANKPNHAMLCYALFICIKDFCSAIRTKMFAEFRCTRL